MILLRRHLHGLATRVEIPYLSCKNPESFYHYLRLLSSCGDIRCLLQLHCRLIVSGLQQDDHVTTHLISSYSLLQNDFARLVLDYTVNPSVVSWNSMIRAYTRSNQHREALDLYSCMLDKGVQPDKYTFTFVLKACTGALDLQEGVSVHRDIAHMGLECDVYIGTSLVHMYSKLGDLSSAKDMFDKMPEKDVVVWNAMIAGLSSVDPHEALEFFRRMQMAGVEPDSASLLNLMLGVSKLSNLDVCRSIHSYVMKKEFNSAVYNMLIDTYCKCGGVYVARCIFEQMLGRDDISWGTMMAGYAHNGCFLEVLELFDVMKRECVRMNKVVAASLAVAAGEIGNLEKGREIHECVMQQGFDKDFSVATSIMTMYAKCGELAKAKQFFDELHERDLVAWSAIVAAFLQAGYPEEALSLFQIMQNENLRPNSVTLLSVLRACAELSSLRLGKSIHCYAVKANIDSHIAAATALISMYAKCGFLTPALVIFNRMPSKDVVTWNALINGYALAGEAHGAIEMFRKLQLSEVKPDPGTMVGLLPPCALLNNLDHGSCIHGTILKCGFHSDSHVQHALIDMYAKCGSFSLAVFLFNQTEFTKGIVSWNIMIAGYMQNGHAKEAISAYHQMKLENFQPNLATIVSVLPAAAFLAALKEGMAIHATIIRMGFQSYKLVGNSLIDMYAKCGWLDYSEKCFHEMENKDTVSWNGMLAGYAIHGLGDSAVSLFSLMQEGNVQVDSISFINVLSACRHAGLVEEGRKIFHSMREKHHIEPNLQHYACMVDLLGRAGLLDETAALIKRMPMKPDAGVWGALLSSSRMHSNVQLAEVALDHLVKLEPGNRTHNVVLSSIYAKYGRWVDTGNTRSKVNQTGLKKSPGCSWVEDKNKVHAFLADDRSHPEFNRMHNMLNLLLQEMEKMGHVPDQELI